MTVARQQREPRWLARIVVDAIHGDQLREHGGFPGVRDENVLESALARPNRSCTTQSGPTFQIWPPLMHSVLFGTIRTETGTSV